MNHTEYDALVGSFYEVLSAKLPFDKTVVSIYDKIKELHDSTKREDLQRYFISLAENHERNNTSLKDITLTYCMLSECLSMVETLDYGNCFLESDKIRLSTTKNKLATMFCVSRAKFYSRFKEQINRTLSKTKVFDKYFEKNNNISRRITQEQYSDSKFTARAKRAPKANTRTRLSPNERHNLVDALSLSGFIDSLDGDNLQNNEKEQ